MPQGAGGMRSQYMATPSVGYSHYAGLSTAYSNLHNNGKDIAYCAVIFASWAQSAKGQIDTPHYATCHTYENPRQFSFEAGTTKDRHLSGRFLTTSLASELL
jgi:hypothetical protein